MMVSKEADIVIQDLHPKMLWRSKLKKIATKFLNRKWSPSCLHKLLKNYHQISTLNWKPEVIKHGLLRRLI